MIKNHIILVVSTFIFLINSTLSLAQDDKPVIFDDFTKKDLSGWISGGALEIKYSHSEDNAENGYGVLYTKTIMKPGNFIGKLIKYKPVLFGVGNYINLMLKGINNDVNIKFAIMYDIDNNGTYNDDKDILLESKPISLNFDDWKQVKIKLDEENFKIISKFNDNFSVAESEAIGVMFEIEAGKNFKESKFESGLALISEIFNKENFISKQDLTTEKDKKSYFEAKNYPNPFNPSTTISYSLPNPGYVKLTVYDRIGREVKVLVDENKQQGSYSVEFNASNLPSGIYFYRIKTAEKTEVRKMILAK
jgi:hypothetical protein